MEQDKTQIFTKADFLTNAKVAKKFDVSIEDATKALKTLYIKHATVRIETCGNNSSRQTPAVTPNVRKHVSNEYLLHPMAHELIKQELAKQGGKQ